MEKILKVDIDEVRENSLLAEDIISSSGMPLVSEGTMLTTDLLRSLKRRGIASLYIKIIIKEEPEEKKKRKANARKVIEQRFSKGKNTPLMQQLKQAVMQYKMEKIDELA